jgi:hypothetical protein
MRKIVIRFFLILLVPALAACGSSDQSGYHGYLYFAKGSYLMQFSLRDSSLNVVTNLGDKTILDLGYFGKTRLLVAESSSVNRQVVRGISWLDLKTGQSSALYSGILARYLSETGLIVYDDGGRLFVVAIGGDSGSETIFSHRKNQFPTVMVVSNDNVLFETSDEGIRKIHFYDVVTGAVRILDELSTVCGLKHSVWIDDLEQLACKEQSSQANDAPYVLVDLEGVVSGNLSLPEGKRFEALTYVSDQGALVLSERWSGIFGGPDKSAVWVHNIHSGENFRLAKNQRLGSSVVYTDF